MASCTIAVRVHVAWWFQPYLNTLLAMCTLFGTRPDIDKVQRVLTKAITVTKV